MNNSSVLLKTSITHNKKEIPLLNLLINCRSARSAPQLSSGKAEYTFRFSNFLIIGLYNSCANSLFEIFSFLTAPPEDILSKIYKSLEQDLFDIHHILDF